LRKLRPGGFLIKTHIDKGISPPREEQLIIIGDVQAYYSFLMSLE
jgi:hypothetical protein